jgi:hypothetical protein
MSQDAIGPRIVRAWFDTIVNPLLAALGSEKTHLDINNYTWQHYNGSFELIKKISQHITPEGRVNMEQFFECYSTVNDLVQKHDTEVEELNRRVSVLHGVLVKAIRNSTEAGVAMPTSELAEIQAYMKDYLSSAKDDNDGAIILAQYIVNYSPELGGQYITALAWNKYRIKLLKLLDISSAFIQSPLKEVQHSNSVLVANIISLTGELRSIRKTLSLKHDVPYMVA